jgi:hypothetical protein
MTFVNGAEDEGAVSLSQETNYPTDAPVHKILKNLGWKLAAQVRGKSPLSSIPVVQSCYSSNLTR